MSTVGYGIVNPLVQFFANDGTPLAGGFVHTYEAGSTTPLDTFTNADLAPGHENTNPIVLDAYGKAVIYLLHQNYKFDVQDANGVSTDGYPRDDIYGLPLAGTANGQLTAVFKSANYAAAVGDLVICTSGSFSVTAPLAVSNANEEFAVVNNGSGTITVVRSGSETVGLATSQVLNPSSIGAQGDAMTFHADGVSNWVIL